MIWRKLSFKKVWVKFSKTCKAHYLTFASKTITVLFKPFTLRDIALNVCTVSSPTNFEAYVYVNSQRDTCSVMALNF